MKLHKLLISAIVETLQLIFEQNQYADDAVENVLKKNAKWGSRDRRFVASTVYEIVRWKRLFKVAIDEEKMKSSNHYYKLIAVYLFNQNIELPEWEEFQGIDKNSLLHKLVELKDIRVYRESIPDWMDELGKRELGEKFWEKELAYLNHEAVVVLRVNKLKTNITQLQNKLKEKGIETENSSAFDELKDETLLLTKRQSLYQLDEYKNGWFEIQDASSQLIAHYLGLKEGLTVIDACAGAGGKSLHIASLMNNKGKIISMDVEEKKLIQLKKRADRAGASSIKAYHLSANGNEIAKFENTADRLLLDVPCSGLGVLRRNADAKWKLNEDFINEVKLKQQCILNNYYKMLKPGGIMLYATCSILPSENQEQVQHFLAKHEVNFEFIKERKVLPSEGFDGFYMAALKRVK